MLPAFKFFHEEVIPLSDFAKFCVHAAFEVDEILPGLEGISRVLVPFADNLVEMAH